MVEIRLVMVLLPVSLGAPSIYVAEGHSSFSNTCSDDVVSEDLDRSWTVQRPRANLPCLHDFHRMTISA